jgi:hypothetical protein
MWHYSDQSSNNIEEFPAIELPNLEMQSTDLRLKITAIDQYISPSNEVHTKNQSMREDLAPISNWSKIPTSKLSSRLEKLSIHNEIGDALSLDPMKDRSQGTTKVNTRGLTLIQIPSNNSFNSHEQDDDDQRLPDDIVQISADKFGKFNFTPKVNPRLKRIKEQELKFTAKSM